MIKKSLIVVVCLCGLGFAQSSGGNRSGSGVAINAATFGLSTAAADNSTAINAAVASLATTGGEVDIPPGTYNVCNPVNVDVSFVKVKGTGTPGSTILKGCAATSAQLGFLQTGYNSPACTQAFGTVTVTGTTPAVLTLPVASVLAPVTTVTASSVLSGSNVIATFSATFSGTTGIVPVAGQQITGSSFSVAGYNSNWTVISGTATTVTAYQAGGSSFGAATGGTLVLSFGFPGVTGTWNNQYVFTGGAQYQVTAQTPTQITLAGTYTGATGAGVPFQGIYSGCPIGVSFENMTIDANCGASNASGTPCQSGGRGTGAGNALACRGCYRDIFRDLIILHAPNDCLYTEGGLFVNNVIPVNAGVTSGTFGLATTVFGENIRFSECNGNGVEHNGPSDGMWINLVGAFTGAVGYKAACIPGSFGVCGNDTFLFGPHMFKTSSWDYQFLVEQYVNMAEAESSATNGAYDVGMQIDGTNSSSGILIANGLAADNITGDGLFISSPPTAFTSGFAVGNSITNVNFSGVTGYGIHVPVNSDNGTAMGKIHISTGILYGPTSGAASGGICWGANSASLNDIRVVNQSATAPSFGIDLSCGGTVTSLNRFIGRNLNAVNFGSQIKWPAAAVASQVDGFVAANSTQNLYCTAANSCAVAIPSGMDVTVRGACNSCADSTDGFIQNVSTAYKVVDQGSCTMAAGTCTAVNLARTYVTAPLCFATWNNTGTLTGILRAPSTTTQVTPSSSVNTDTAVVNWICLGQ